ncbi:MAG: hypothetical protein AAGU05_13530 [Anaerolineaceae bacterium]
MAKKAETPPYVLRVLTAEYLVEGTVKGDTFLSFATDEQIHTPIHFTSARITHTRSAQSSVITYPELYLKTNQALIYIPDTDYVLLPQNRTWQQFKTPLTGDFYIGPYRLNGRLMTMDRFMFNDEMPVLDVRISSPPAGAGWQDLYAPMAVINANKLHAWSEG